MLKVYEIKTSPGTGMGVFATKDIPAGTTIMQDHAVMHLPQDSQTEKQVLGALKALSPKDQTRFQELHEGSADVPGKHLRIYQADMFGNEDTRISYIYLEVSCLNHSCMPNAELRERTGKTAEEETDIVATAKIAKGEEVHINYRCKDFDGMTHEQRNKLLAAYYAFRCACPVCALPPEKLVLSDARRQLIEHVTWKQQGYTAPDVRSADRMTPAEVQKHSPSLWHAVNPLEKPLSTQELVQCNVLLANLREAEGLLDERTALFYKEAAHHLVTLQQKELLIFASVEFIRVWMKKPSIWQ
jgi:hypothetical protein